MFDRLRARRAESQFRRTLRETCTHPPECRTTIHEPGKDYTGPGTAVPLVWCSRCNQQIQG